MGYVLHAVLAHAGMMTLEGKALEVSELVGLPQGFELLPVTDELLDLWGGEGVFTQAFEGLNTGLLERLERWSGRGRVAFLEIETWAGVDEHRAAAVWEATQLIYGPEKCGGNYEVTNAALRLLGVQTAHGPTLDEFEALELHRKRHTSNWLG